MNIGHYIRLNADAPEYFETYIGLRPCSNAHPPSLKNPTPVPVPMAQDGWKDGASKAERKQAQDDLLEILKMSRRQIGKPEIAHTALYPVFPAISTWT